MSALVREAVLQHLPDDLTETFCNPLDPSSPVTVLAVSPDGSLCATADTAGCIEVFDVENTKVR